MEIKIPNLGETCTTAVRPPVLLSPTNDADSLLRGHFLGSSKPSESSDSSTVVHWRRRTATASMSDYYTRDSDRLPLQALTTPACPSERSVFTTQRQAHPFDAFESPPKERLQAHMSSPHAGDDPEITPTNASLELKTLVSLMRNPTVTIFALLQYPFTGFPTSTGTAGMVSICRMRKLFSSVN